MGSLCATLLQGATLGRPPRAPQPALALASSRAPRNASVRCRSSGWKRRKPRGGRGSRSYQHLTLALQTLPTLLGKALDPGKNRLGIKMRLSNYIGFEAASQPLIVPVGGQ